MNLKEKLQKLRNKGTMGLDALFDEASECLKQHELSKVYSMSPTAPTHWHGKAAGIIFAIESLQSLKAALPDSAAHDDADKPHEAESGREADQLLIEAVPLSRQQDNGEWQEGVMVGRLLGPTKPRLA